MKAWNTIYTFLLLLCSLASQAQDIITFTNGDEVRATVVEVNDLNLSYKLFAATDSTIHTTKVSSVFMIRYASGTKQVFGNMPPSYTEQVDKLADKELAKLKAQTDYAKYSRIYQKKKWMGISFTATGGALLLVGVPLAIAGDLRDGDRLNGAGNGMMEAGVLCTVAGAAFTIIGAINLGVMPKYKKKRDAAASQLSLYPTTQSIQPVGKIGSSYSGIAMRITF